MERPTLLISIENVNDSVLAKYNQQANKNKSSTDSGFDLIIPETVTIPGNQSKFIDLKVRCEPQFKTGYYLYPRSSIGKTPLRLSNSVGIIDYEYRGTLRVWVDNISNSEFTLNEGDRYFQVCHPSLAPMNVEIVDIIDINTNRGEGGFGSTGRN